MKPRSDFVDHQITAIRDETRECPFYVLHCDECGTLWPDELLNHGIHPDWTDDNDERFLCDTCGRIGNADDGIAGDATDCPDEECGGTVHRIREEV